MFKCPHCSNRYKTKTSLTRHAHNHTQGSQHACEICHVRFRRRDLLARHEKIHSGLPQQTSNARPRRRCHTACNICRSERKRCDGQWPCSSCVSADETCSYSSNTRRISQAPPPIAPQDTVHGDRAAVEPDNTTANADSSASPISRVLDFALSPACLSASAQQINHSPESTSLQQGQAGLGTINMPFTGPTSSMDHGQTRDVFHQTPQTDFCHTAHLDDILTGIPHDFNSTFDSSYFDNISWPWTHQSIYFQEGLGMYTADPAQFAEQADFDPSNDVLNSQNVQPGAFASNDQASSNSHSTMQLPLSVESDDQAPDSSQDIERRQKVSLESIISHAFDLEQPRFDHTQYWTAKSQDIKATFMPNSESQLVTNEQSLLDVYVDLYFENFHPLWPLLWKHSLEYGHIHPVLYLVLVSIGTMYDGAASQKFGSMLHERLRDALFTLPLEIHQPEKDMLHLGCSLLLTKVAALYFEQQHAFSAAKRLGGMLVALAQRLELFNTRRVSLEAQTSADAIVAAWITNESRKRLAYGIMRAEAFVSVLLNTKPLVDYEEINLELPVPDNIWMSHPIRSEVVLDAIKQDKRLGPGVLFSDLVRIALDQNETLPLTKATSHELLIFGLQHSVWRFAQDPYLFLRLTGQDEASEPPCNGSTGASDILSNRQLSISQQPKKDYLDFTARAMADLRKEKHRVLQALEKWKQGLANSQLLANQDGDSRSVYLSSTLLYHLSLLRLHAPITMLQQAAYELNGNGNFKSETIEKTHRWVRNDSSSVAVEHACAIWRLIDSETSRLQAEQARYNILALIGLHQAAVTIWAYASVLETSNIFLCSMPVPEGIQSAESLLCRANIGPLLANFVKLYPRITPAWGMQSSFSRVAMNMSKKSLQFQSG